MFWIGTAFTVVAGIVALASVMLVRHPADVSELGSVSTRWLAQHRVN